jgi:glycosyltransferase involved in cell wall biosynthesis
LSQSIVTIKDKVEILFITHYSQYYGANRSLVNIIQGLKKLNYKIKVIAPSLGEFTDVLDRMGCDYEVVPFYPFVYRRTRLSFFLKKIRYNKNIKALEKLKVIVQQNQPSLIYSNSSVFDIGFRLAQEEKIPHVWHIREMAELHYGYRFYPNKKHFLTALKQTDLIIAISKAIGAKILDENGIENYRVLYNAVFSKQDFQELLSKKYSAKENVIFTVVGMLHPSKQQATVIKSFARINKKYPNTELWIAGDGQYIYTLYLKLLILFYGLKGKVKLLGYISDLQKVYVETDVVVTASLHEGLGRSTIEGMAYQKPIIGFRSGATPELVENEKRGLLFDNKTEGGLVTAMEIMIKNPKKRKEMGALGRAFVADRFMIDGYTKQLDFMLRELIEKRS